MSQEEPNNSSQHLGDLDLPLPTNFNDLPKFCNLVRLFTQLAAVHGKGSVQTTNNVVEGFIRAWKTNIGNNIYPAVRLWFPQEDDEFRQLSKIKDAVIGKMIVEALDLPFKSSVATSLVNVKSGGYVASGSNPNGSNDDGLAYRAKRAIDERFPVRPYSDLSIGVVVSKLEKFIDSGRKEQSDIIRFFLTTLNSDEFYWLLKIIQNKLNIRCSEKTFLRAFHPNAEQVYLVNKSLKTVCYQLWSGDFSVTEKNKTVRPLSFFCPMLAKYIKGMSVDFDACISLVCDQSNKNTDKGTESIGGCYIEEKLDGERIQLHWVRNGNITKIFSRRSMDHTIAYKGIFDEFQNRNGHIIPQKEMSELLCDSVSSVILDGEVVAWDPQTNDFCGQSKVRELTHYVKPGQFKHMAFIFDIVYLNGEVLTSMPLIRRKELLKEVFDPSKKISRLGRLEILPYKHGFTANDIAAEFKKIVTEMSEGLVVKNPNSVYSLNTRNNDWVKVKPEYVDGSSAETLDLVLVGAYRGKGKFQNKFGSYLCALRDENVANRFIALSKVGSGICMAMHDHIDQLINSVRFNSKTPPRWLDISNMLDSMPDFFIPYNEAPICEVKYSEIISPSTIRKNISGNITGYGAGFSLRFPRYVKLRSDKTYETATSVAELLEIYKGRQIYLHQHGNCAVSKKRNIVDNMSSRAKRVDQNQKRRYDEATKNLVIKSRALAGHTFYICGDIEKPINMTEMEFERFIRENGGIVKDVYDSEIHAIADRLVPKAAALSNRGEVIFHPCWLFDSAEVGHLLTPEPIHCFIGSPRNASGAVDKYGFSLTRTQTVSEIKRLVDAMDLNNKMFTEDDLNAGINYWKLSCGTKLRTLLFSGFTFYVDRNSMAYEKMKLISSLIKYSGGKLTMKKEDASHIISDSQTFDESGVYNSRRVNSAWIESSWFSNDIKSSFIKFEL